MDADADKHVVVHRQRVRASPGVRRIPIIRLSTCISFGICICSACDPISCPNELTASIRLSSTDVLKWDRLCCPGELCDPGGLVVLSDEVIVCDISNHRLQCFSIEGRYTRAIGRSASKGVVRM